MALKARALLFTSILYIFFLIAKKPCSATLVVQSYQNFWISSCISESFKGNPPSGFVTVWPIIQESVAAGIRSVYKESIFIVTQCILSSYSIITTTTAHIHKIYKILHIKTLKTLRHVSVLRPSSGSYIFLAKVTLEIVAY